MKVRVSGHLPYVTATLTFQGRKLTLEHVVVDSGSAASVFSADEVAQLGILPEHTDFLHRVRGVGGFEFVYSKRVESLGVGALQVDDFEIQVGALRPMSRLTFSTVRLMLVRARSISSREAWISFWNSRRKAPISS